MDTLHAKILQILRKQKLKPGELAKKCNISRQALHRHVRVLIDAKQIYKQGAGPHVEYCASPDRATTTRVREDYTLCRQRLLPEYVKDYADFLAVYVQKQPAVPSSKHTIQMDFLLDAAAVYSSNIEGNTLNLNSFLNSRMSPSKHRPKEAQEIEDLVSAYTYAKKVDLSEKHMLHVHKILSSQFIAKSRQGVYRREPVGVFSQYGLEYMAIEPHLVEREMHELFSIISQLLREKHTPAECFFWATWLHLMITLIHPFSDGNGRTARLCEKWFLGALLGEQGYACPSEECYWFNRSKYYAALKLGVNYWETDIAKAQQFFALLPQALQTQSGK